MNICGYITAVLNTCSHLFVRGLFSGVNTELILREHFNGTVSHKFVLGIKHTMNECVCMVSTSFAGCAFFLVFIYYESVILFADNLQKFYALKCFSETISRYSFVEKDARLTASLSVNHVHCRVVGKLNSFL